jgi:hypothetical protein
VTEDLAPEFPLPAPGDYVLVLASGGAGTAPGRPGLQWCQVLSVRAGPYDLFPVIVALPAGGKGAYQQHEIRGWHPGRRRRTRLRRLLGARR